MTEPPYQIIQKTIPLGHIRQFHFDYKKRPKHRVRWSVEKQEAFLASLIRRLFIPPIVLRELDTPPPRYSPCRVCEIPIRKCWECDYRPYEMLIGEQILKKPQSPNKNKFEVLDGWQRIHSIDQFDIGKITLPGDLKDQPFYYFELPYEMRHEVRYGVYNDLTDEMKTFFNETLTLNINIIAGIGDTKNPKHEQLALSIYKQLRK